MEYTFKDLTIFCKFHLCLNYIFESHIGTLNIIATYLHL